MEPLKQPVYCKKCNGKTNHWIIKTYKETSNPEDEFQWHDTYHIVKCMGCNTIAFVKQYGTEDDWDYISGDRQWFDTFQVYPEQPNEDEIELEAYRRKYHLEPKIFHNSPENIQELYTQTIESFNMTHYILCAAGLRTLIEGICLHLNIKKGYLYNYEGNRISVNNEDNPREHKTLGGKIFGLYENGKIILPKALILQEIVKIGNDAVHSIVIPKHTTLKEIIRILEGILEDVFELKHHQLLDE
ncbi:DUF4145 domain-containing protein [Bacillus massiliigorillae]|uniref:DUF4145 domain-containing protein n=1 Tax=Bacillus massiliigorillae TaxID=1243664 RepID=UPI0003A87090|nr:DUF4145 domain-containing protein [Bacillus massiliigorillae]